MHEMLLSAGKLRLVFPDSGPGPITAVGDQNVAYFGEVTNAELFTAADLKAQIPEITPANVANDSYTWLKFKYYDKYLFIKKYPIFSGGGVMTWAALYRNGLIYGEDTEGDYQYGASTNQLRFVTKGAHRFKVRTITGDATSATTQTPNSGATDTTPRRQSMFTELIYRVCNDAIGSAYPEEKFAAFDYSQLIATQEVNREVLKNGTYPQGRVLTRGNMVALNPRIAVYSNNNYDLVTPISWRPVLELEKPNQVYKARGFTYETSGFLKTEPTSVSIALTPVATDVKRLSAFNIQTKNVVRPSSAVALLSGEPRRLTAIKPVSANVLAPTNTSFTYVA